MVVLTIVFQGRNARFQVSRTQDSSDVWPPWGTVTSHLIPEINMVEVMVDWIQSWKLTYWDHRILLDRKGSGILLARCQFFWLLWWMPPREMISDGWGWTYSSWSCHKFGVCELMMCGTNHDFHGAFVGFPGSIYWYLDTWGCPPLPSNTQSLKVTTYCVWARVDQLLIFGMVIPPKKRGNPYNGICICLHVMIYAV